MTLVVSMTAIGRGLADQNCKDTLIIETLKKHDYQSSDWRLAKELSSTQWDQLKHDLGASVPIYGQVLGLSWKDYHARAVTMGSVYRESMRTVNINDLDWQGVDTTAYIACLKAQNLKDLKMEITSSDRDDVQLWIRYNGDYPGALKLRWVLPSHMRSYSGLPTHIAHGIDGQFFRIQRPAREMHLCLNAGDPHVSIAPANCVDFGPLAKAPPPLPQPSPCLSFIGEHQHFLLEAWTIKGSQYIPRRPWDITITGKTGDQKATFSGVWYIGHPIYAGDIDGSSISFRMGTTGGVKYFDANGKCAGEIVGGQMTIINPGPQELPYHWNISLPK